MNGDLPNVESVSAKAGVDPEVVRAVLEAARAARSTEPGTGSSHKVEIPTAKVVPFSNISS